MQKYVRKLRNLRHELDIDQAGAITLFKRLYLTRKGAEKLFIEASDRDAGGDEESKVEDAMNSGTSAT